MSNDIGVSKSEHNPSITTTSFNGGQFCGRSLQLTQSKGGTDIHNVQLTKEQVVQQISIMTEWLGLLS